MRRIEQSQAMIVAMCALMGCGGDVDPDGGPDTGSDAATTDSGTIDSGMTDGGMMDSAVDAAMTDGGMDAMIDGGDAGTFTGTLPPVHAAATGLTFSAVIDGTGALWMYGGATSGSLGNGGTPGSGPHHGNAYVPMRPSVIDGFTMTHVAAGWMHMIALQSTGEVWTWGTNDSGQLGNDTMPTVSLVPVQIDIGNPAIDVAAGANHTLAIDNAGAAWAWGSNGSGQLGDGTTTTSAVPVAVDASGVSFAAVAAGTDHSLGLAEDGTVWAWGSGRFQLGFGGLSVARTPQQVVGEGGVGNLSQIVAIASGRGHALALAVDGTLWAWGDNSQGQLGDDSGVPSDTPVRVDTSGLSGISGIRAGENQSFALLSDGSLWGWGENGNEQLGLPTGDVTTPARIDITGGARDVAGARDHGIAIGASGGFWSWGQNDRGIQGTGLTSASATPASTYGPAALTPTAVWAAREDYSFIQMSDGSVWGVGRGWRQSGNILGGASPVLVVPVMGMSVAQMAGGQNHTLVLDAGGAVWAFGNNGNGQLGDGTMTTSDTAVAVDFSALSAGVTIVEVGVDLGFSAALASDGTVWTWGRGINGQLGDGTDGQSSTPVQVHNSTDTGFLGGITDIAMGGDHMVALDSSGFAWTWGIAGGGALGATPLNSCSPSGRFCNRLPQRVCDVGSDLNTCTATGSSLGPVDAIAAGGDHTMFLRSGQVLATGAKNLGQLGDNAWSATTRASVPIVVVNATDTGPLTGIAWIAADGQNSFAGAADGTVYAWGANSEGQLAQDPATTACGTRSCRPRPTVIAGLAGVTVSDLSPGSQHVLALDDAGVIWSWGSTDNGQIGRLGWVRGPGGGRISFAVSPITLLPR